MTTLFAAVRLTKMHLTNLEKDTSLRDALFGRRIAAVQNIQLRGDDF